MNRFHGARSSIITGHVGSPPHPLLPLEHRSSDVVMCGFTEATFSHCLWCFMAAGWSARIWPPPAAHHHHHPPQQQKQSLTGSQWTGGSGSGSRWSRERERRSFSAMWPESDTASPGCLMPISSSPKRLTGDVLKTPRPRESGNKTSATTPAMKRSGLRGAASICGACCCSLRGATQVCARASEAKNKKKNGVRIELALPSHETLPGPYVQMFTTSTT